MSGQCFKAGLIQSSPQPHLHTPQIHKFSSLSTTQTPSPYPPPPNLSPFSSPHLTPFPPFLTPPNPILPFLTPPNPILPFLTPPHPIPPFRPLPPPLSTQPLNTLPNSIRLIYHCHPKEQGKVSTGNLNVHRAGFPNLPQIPQSPALRKLHPSTRQEVLSTSRLFTWLPSSLIL